MSVQEVRNFILEQTVNHLQQAIDCLGFYKENNRDVDLPTLNEMSNELSANIEFILNNLYNH